jgi:hypothetical protein
MASPVAHVQQRRPLRTWQTKRTRCTRLGCRQAGRSFPVAIYSSISCSVTRPVRRAASVVYFHRKGVFDPQERTP